MKFPLLVLFSVLLVLQGKVCTAVNSSVDCYGLNPANFDHDCYIDFYDFTRLAEQWLSYDESVNITGDSYIGIGDLAAFVQQWLAYERTNYIPKFTEPDTISNSVVYEDSGNIGIGTTSPHEKLTVAYPGNIKLQEGRPSGANRSTYIGTTADGQNTFDIGTSGGAQIEFEHRSNGDDLLHFLTHESAVSHARRMTINEAGNVGIGYTDMTDPASKLAVNGKVGIGTDTPHYDIHVVGGDVALESGGPAYYIHENDQQGYSYDYGWWRMIASHNAFFIEDWEKPGSQPGDLPFNQEDEFLTFHRIATTHPAIGDHLMTCHYSFKGSGARNLRVGANWKNDVTPQTARILSLVALDESAHTRVNVMRIIPNDANPKVIFPNGNVGIRTSNPGNILTVAQGSYTDPIADAWTIHSSKKWKTNIRQIESALEKVSRLNGVTFDWKKDGKHDIGLIAEDVGENIPEIVAYEKNGKDAQGLDYARLVPILIEAIKEQQKQIDHLKLYTREKAKCRK